MCHQYKKAIIGLIVVGLLSPMALLHSPSNAHAIASGSVVEAVIIADTPLNIREIADAALWAAVKYAIRAMTSSIVDWINSGFEGDPLYLTNPGDFFEDVALEVTGAFIYELGLEDSPLCTGFRTPVIRALVPRPYKISAQCTIEDVVENIEEFTVGNWEEGGWAGWIQLTQHPQNNPYGAYIMANEELRKRRLEAQTQKRQELLEGGGFLSFRRCVARAPIPGPSNPLAHPGTPPGDIVTEFGEGDDPSTIGVDGDGPCMRYETDTPGHTIANQLDLQLGSGTRSRELADEFNESIAAIIDALINQFMLQGLRALSGDESRGVDPYYTEAIDRDKKTLVNQINIAIKEADAEIESNEKIGDLLVLINETKACYEDQKETIQKSEFNPPSGVAPSIGEVNEKIQTLEDKRLEAIKSFGEVSTDQAIREAAFLEDLRARAQQAETPAEVSSVWSLFSAYRQANTDSSKRGGAGSGLFQDVVALHTASNPLSDLPGGDPAGELFNPDIEDPELPGAEDPTETRKDATPEERQAVLAKIQQQESRIQKEKAQCEEDNAIFEQYWERATPVDCVGGCIEGGDEEEDEEE